MAEKKTEETSEKKGLLAKICEGIRKYKKEIFIGAVASGVISLIPYYCHLSDLYRERIEILNQRIKCFEVKEAEQEPNALIGDTRELLFKTQGRIEENNKKYLSLIKKSNELVKIAEILEYNLKIANDFSIASQIKLLKETPNYSLVFFKSRFRETTENLESLMEKTDKYSIKEIKDRITKKEPWGIYGDFNDDRIKDIVIHEYTQKKIIIKSEDDTSEEYAVTDSTFLTEVILVKYGLPNGNFGFFEKMPQEIYKSVWEKKIFKESGTLSY